LKTCQKIPGFIKIFFFRKEFGRVIPLEITVDTKEKKKGYETTLRKWMNFKNN
jgi:hypothetical protein